MDNPKSLSNHNWFGPFVIGSYLSNLVESRNTFDWVISNLPLFIFLFFSFYNYHEPEGLLIHYFFNVFFLYLIALTHSNLSSFCIKCVWVWHYYAPNFLKPRKPPKKCMNLQPMKLSKYNSYVSYCRRKIISSDPSSPQCKRSHIWQRPQLSGCSLTFHIVDHC